MAGPNAPYTALDANQVLKQSFDEVNDRLRVDAEVTAIVENVTVNVDDIIIRDATNASYKLKVESDGSVNANVAVDASGGDNIAISDGTNTLVVNPSGSINIGQITGPISLPTGAATEATLSSLLTELQQKTEPSDAQNIRALTSGTDSVTVPGVATETTLSAINTKITTTINGIKTDSYINNFPSSFNIGSITGPVALPTGAATEATLSLINSKMNTLGQKIMANSMPVVLASDQTSLPITLSDEPIKISGTEDGLPSGTEFTFVNNRRLQIMDAKDRQQSITYADFGTKDERITQIDYTATSIGTGAGYTVRKNMSYSLVGTKYRLDTITYSLI